MILNYMKHFNIIFTEIFGNVTLFNNESVVSKEIEQLPVCVELYGFLTNVVGRKNIGSPIFDSHELDIDSMK
jgi:hypothetical protein